MSHARWLCVALLAALSTLAVDGCSGRRLPPGTPPPEYEPPVVTPWAPESLDAGADSAPPTASEAPNAHSADTGPDLSLDAGPR